MYVQESKFICSNFSSIEFFIHVLNIDWPNQWHDKFVVNTKFIAPYLVNLLFIKDWAFMLKFTFQITA